MARSIRFRRIPLKGLALLCGLGLLLDGTVAFAATESYLLVSGVVGESKINKGAIDVFNAYLGAAQEPQNSSRVQWTSFSLNNYVDTSTAALQSAYVSHIYFSSAKFVMKIPGATVPFFEIEMENAKVASFATATLADGREVVNEQFSFERIKLTDSAGVTASYDLTNNTGSSPASILQLLSESGIQLPLPVYSPTASQLTIPSVAIGAATYSNMVVTINDVVSGPAGASPNGSLNVYDPGSGELVIPSVVVGSSVFFNAVCKVSNLVKVGSVGGADSFDPGSNQLSLASVRVGNTVYNNVIIKPGSIIGVAGGMPANAQDVYDPATKELMIAAVEAYGNVYTNVTITVGLIVSVGQ